MPKVNKDDLAWVIRIAMLPNGSLYEMLGSEQATIAIRAIGKVQEAVGAVSNMPQSSWPQIAASILSKLTPEGNDALDS